MRAATPLALFSVWVLSAGQALAQPQPQAPSVTPSGAPSPAPAAQPETATTASAYDQRVTQALRAFQAGRWTEARSHFRRAHELDPTARTLRTMGMCSFNLGDYPDAVQNLESALGDPRRPLTEEQKSQVGDLIARANAKLARFRLQLSPADATLLIDGAQPVLGAGGELLLEPGRHELLASAPGYATRRRSLSVEAGDRSLLELQLDVAAPPSAAASTPAANAPAAPAASAPGAATAYTSQDAATSAPADDGSSRTRSTLGYISLGVGAAGLATFAVTGALALSEKSELEDACPAQRCPPPQYTALDRYDRFKTISTIGLVAGGALLSLGVVLLLIGDDDAGAERARIEPQLGFGWAGLRGSL